MKVETAIKRLKGAGFKPAGTTPATELEDAAVSLEDGREIQLCLDGTFVVLVPVSGENFLASFFDTFPEVLSDLAKGA